ncbi:MAG: SDR family oxidoreductase [Deltaproteobacteria bacterium]|nr:SDR family oxidoreductase [Deltaproteobacteria bacterium]
MRVLVTGGAGFIGSHLCDRLVEAGADVLCLDNFLTGSKKNVEHLFGKPNFELLRHDVVEPILLEPDRIYNLACPSAPVHYRKNAVKTVKTNVMGAIHMLGMAKRTKARLLQASASEVYGSPPADAGPIAESYRGRVNPIGLRACYNEGKRVAETLVRDYRIQNRVDARIARIFNTFGPRMAPDDGRVVSTFIVAALKGEPLAVHGDGSQKRSFCYVSDMVEGLLRLMEAPAPEGPVNMGNPGEVSILQLAEMIIALSGSKSEIRFAPLPGEDTPGRRPDISLARELLSWEPGVGLEEGLKRTIAWFQDNGLDDC